MIDDNLEQLDLSSLKKLKRDVIKFIDRIEKKILKKELDDFDASLAEESSEERAGSL